jgi:hypothetical protein
MTREEAQAALRQIEGSQRTVVAEVDMPTWYWWGLALGWIGLGVVTDLHHAWWTAGGTLAFGAVHASVSGRVLSGRRRSNQLSVRQDVAGRHLPLIVIGSLLTLAGLTVAGTLAARADGARHPVTVASLVVAIVIVLGGPALMGAVRRRSLRRSAVV